LQIGDTGYVSGLGVGVDAQLYIKNAAVPANGTYAALNVEIYSEGASSDPSAATEVAFIRVVNNGNATGVGKVDDKAFLFDLSGFTSGAAKLWYDHQGSAPANIEEWLKIKTPGGTRWIPAYDAVV
jgi:stress response protein SCP2